MQHIIQALTHLDVQNDSHWTGDGQARVDVVSGVLAEKGFNPVTRQDIIDAAPTFVRVTAEKSLAEMGYAAPPAAPPVADRELFAPAESGVPIPPSPAQPVEPAPHAERSIIQPSESTFATGGVVDGMASLAEAEERSAMDMPLDQVMRSPVLLEKVLGEIGEKSQALNGEKKRIEEELKELYTKSDLCTRQLSRIKPKEDPNKGIQDYLRASAKANEARIKRSRRFIDAGVDPADVAAELTSGSKLDRVMSQRKPEHGSTRPALGIPVRK